jgi:hypothetical protein
MAAKSFEKSSPAAVRRLPLSVTRLQGVTVSMNLESNHLISRRAFTVDWVLAMLAGATIVVTGCGDKSSPSSPSSNSGGTSGTAQDVTGTVSANHGHVATVKAVDIRNGIAVTPDITGTATHTHMVSLTATQVQQIGNRQQVVVTSTTDAAHSHTVTFN